MITVFTPTYNRAHLITRVYESLCALDVGSQFEWLVVDDGSTDNTREVMSIIKSNHKASFLIHYLYKKNGGKHTAINLGVKEAKGELFFILDSDDYMTSDALKTVELEYAKVKGDASIGGVVGLDCFADGRIVGNGLPCDTIDCNSMDIRFKYHVVGDMKEVFRTEVLKEYPFPVIEGERFCPEQLVWFRIAQNYKLHYFNKAIYVAEYQTDGISAGITRIRMDSPIASTTTYAELCSYDVPFAQKVKAAINYWRFRLCVKRGKSLSINPLWIVVVPIAFVMHLRDRKCLN